MGLDLIIDALSILIIIIVPEWDSFIYFSLSNPFFKWISNIFWILANTFIITLFSRISVFKRFLLIFFLNNDLFLF